MGIYYSSNEETFNYDSIDEAVEDLIENNSDIKVGDCVRVYSGESESVDVKHYVPNIIEHMGEIAYDDMGEFADDFPDCTQDVDQQIQNEVEILIERLFEKHKLMPSFYKIKNQKTIEVCINNVDDVSFDVTKAV